MSHLIYDYSESANHFTCYIYHQKEMLDKWQPNTAKKRKVLKYSKISESYSGNFALYVISETISEVLIFWAKW